jgi:hypothetical protein
LAVPGITQTGHNVANIIQFFIDGPDVNIHIRVLVV